MSVLTKLQDDMKAAMKAGEKEKLQVIRMLLSDVKNIDLAPKKLTEDVHAVGYFETRNSWRQLMSFEARGEDILYSTRVPYARRWEGKGKLTPGRWHDFALHVLWSRDPGKGFVEVWFDGEQVVPRAMTATLLDENEAFFQIGLMRATSDLPETIIIDHVIEATTLEEVMPPRLAKSR